jgi:hypothetical protein
MSAERSAASFLRALPRWYIAWVVLLILWAVFVGAENVWQHITGTPFWPVTP